MLELISYVSQVHRRDFDLDDVTLLDPTEADALESGEWVTINSDNQVIRATDGTIPAFQVWMDKGDYSAQALGKCPVLFLNEYEAETDMYDSTKTYAINEPLTTDEVTIDAVARAALTNVIVADTSYIQGYVTMLPADTPSGMLRFRKCMPYLSPAAHS